MSSLVGIMTMAVLLSLSLGLFTSFLTSFNDCASALRKEFDVAGEIIAEERLSIEVSSNSTHALLSLTNKATKEVTIPYIGFKHGEKLQMSRIDLKIPPLSTIHFAIAIPQDFLNPTPEVILIAKRGAIYKTTPSSITCSLSLDAPYTKIPHDDVCLINDVDVVDHAKGIIVASYENGGILMLDVKQPSPLWSREFLGSRTENVMFNTALNATIASISSIRESGAKMLTVIAFRNEMLLFLHNFYDYIYRSSSVREYIHHPALSGKNQNFIVVPKSFFIGNYSTNNYWTFESGFCVNVIRSSSPSVKETLLQRVLILDTNTRITPGYYQLNPEVFPKFRAIGYAPINQSFSVLLVNGAVYRESDIVYVRYRCDTIRLGSDILVPPTLHALQNDAPSWYLSLYPCDLSAPNFLAHINGVIAVASGPYLYLISTDGRVLQRVDYSPEKITFLKSDENYNKLVIWLTNGKLMILNDKLEEEKSFSLTTTAQVIDVVIASNSRIVILDETKAFDPEDSAYVISLPSRPYKAVALGLQGVLVASPSGLLYLKT